MKDLYASAARNLPIDIHSARGLRQAVGQSVSYATEVLLDPAHTAEQGKRAYEGLCDVQDALRIYADRYDQQRDANFAGHGPLGAELAALCNPPTDRKKSSGDDTYEILHNVTCLDPSKGQLAEVWRSYKAECVVCKVPVPRSMESVREVVAAFSKLLPAYACSGLVPGPASPVVLDLIEQGQDAGSLYPQDAESRRVATAGLGELRERFRQSQVLEGVDATACIQRQLEDRPVERKKILETEMTMGGQVMAVGVERREARTLPANPAALVF